jgi:quercetin dioxygenase-like cupin family protein
MTALRPYQLDPDGGKAIWHLGALMRFKALSEDTNGQFWLAEQFSDKGYASPLHRHTNEDELFIVLDGELRIGVGDKVMEVPSGGLAFAPRGLPHTFSVESPNAHFMVLSTPGGFEKWFIETGQPYRGESAPPPPETPVDFGNIVASLARYSVEVLGGPPD